MGQMGFYDLDKRLDVISGKGDPLELIKATVPWESFRAEIEAVTRAKPQERKSAAGRKAFEYLIRDRLSFMRFLDLGLEDPVPDATTVWLFREALAKAGLVAKLFALFNQHLEAKGYIARGGQIVDATIVSAPRQHNSRSENAAIKAGKTPAGWQEKPAKNAQKDKDARWTKKHDQSFYGYKNHIGIDRMHKLIRRYTETDASVHDSQMLDDVLDKSNTGAEVWADSAYRSAESEAKLEAKGYKSRVHRRARRNHPLSAREQAGNTTRSRVRARVEHVFGHQHTSMGGTIVRTIGIVRARTKIGLMNLVYNISRLVQLERVVAAPA
jgi:IS5 family transposase